MAKFGNFANYFQEMKKTGEICDLMDFLAIFKNKNNKNSHI